MGAEIAKRLALLIAQKLGKKNENSELQAIGIALIAAIAGVVLLVAFIIHVLTSPIELIGALLDFQQQYSYVIPAETNIISGPLDEARIEQIAADVYDPLRRLVIHEALSLVGKVPYFWGGKADAGWNDEWGQLKEVTAEGSATTGTLQPYGLDCTGFVYWAFWTALGHDCLPPATANSLWNGTYEITEDELEPGDIAYKDLPTVAVNHVGIYLGDTDGKHVFIHCSFSGGGVVMNSYSGFQFFRRVPALDPS